MSRVLKPTKKQKKQKQPETRELIKRVHELFMADRFVDALDTLRKLHKSPDAQTFLHKIEFNQALCCAALNRRADALAHLKAAVAAGYDQVQNFQHPLFTPLQDDDEFFLLLSSLLEPDVAPVEAEVNEADLPPPRSLSIATRYSSAPKLQSTEIDVMDDDDDEDDADREDESYAPIAKTLPDASHDDDGDDDDDDGRLIDRRKVPLPAPAPVPAIAANDAVKALADTANRLAVAGRAADARRVFQRMLELTPGSPAVLVQWANLEATVQDKHEACRLLKLAAQSGFTAWHVLEAAPVFAKVLAMPEFQEIVKK